MYLQIGVTAPRDADSIKPSSGAAKAVSSAPTVRLATQGRALMPIIVGAKASKSVTDAAAQLAQYLSQMSGATFTVERGDGKTGLALGVAAEFPALRIDVSFDLNDPTQREDYLLRSHAHGVYLIGSTYLAVQHAVWDILYRLGYRQFFPGKNWEIVPRMPELRVAVDQREHPHYLARQIWFSYSTWPENLREHSEWSARNRATSGVEISISHAYDRIVQANKEAFAVHPEYFSIVNGKPTSKFNIANRDLRKLVVDHAIRYFEKYPTADSISMEPSDQGSWGDSAEEKQLGSISDRVVLLANEVAEAVSNRFDRKYIGLLAYKQHSPPPNIRVHPNVVVHVATSYTASFSKGSSVAQLLEGWKKQGATIGIYEYYSIPAWDRDMPRVGGASRLDSLQSTIPRFYRIGARFMSAESSDNWGPHGLGYYLAARMLWNTDEASRLDELVNDFLDKAFGPARGPMADYYKLLRPDPLVPITDRTTVANDGLPMTDSYVGRLYRNLQAARKLSNDRAIRARLDDLVLYTRYVELYGAYFNAKGSERQSAFESIIRFSYRIRRTHMVHSRGLYLSLPDVDRSVNLPDAARWTVDEPANPWKSSEPFKPEEIEGFIQAGVTK